MQREFHYSFVTAILQRPFYFSLCDLIAKINRLRGLSRQCRLACGEIDGGRGYEDLLAETSAVSLEDGSLIRALDLTTLIGIKERSGRPKDLAALPVLRATLDESTRR